MVEGTAHFYPFSAHPLATRMQEPHIAQEQVQHDERALRMAALAQSLELQFSSATVATVNRHGFVYLRRGDQREERNVISGPWAGGHIKLFDYSHTSAPDYHVPHRHTLLMVELPAAVRLPDFALSPGHYLERYLVHMDELPPGGPPEGYRMYSAPGRALAVDVLPAALLRALQTLGPLYVEVRDGVLLAFSPQHALEDETRAGLMVTLATALGTS